MCLLTILFYIPREGVGLDQDSIPQIVPLIVIPMYFDSELISIQYTILVTGFGRQGKDLAILRWFILS